jgi:chaperonin GroES
MAKLFPALDWTVLELEDAKYAGTLIIPDSAMEAPKSGVVVAVGPGKKGESMLTKVGDRVLFPQYSGLEVEWEGKKLLCLREPDITCYIKEEA